jgi:hypothetical protein
MREPKDETTRDEAARLALDAANRLWGFPTANEVLVILDEFVEESEAAWAFTYNTRMFAQTGDVMLALGVGNGPIVVAKATGEVYPMPSSYNCLEALLVWHGRTSDRA